MLKPTQAQISAKLQNFCSRCGKKTSCILSCEGYTKFKERITDTRIDYKYLVREQ